MGSNNISLITIWITASNILYNSELSQSYPTIFSEQILAKLHTNNYNSVFHEHNSIGVDTTSIYKHTD